ncbi:MAG TPA: PRC-barrel domain-containing protein [Acidimicrobiales bacterium]|nr:PRC-barrel domain-containing protein [Acidimicrobiales bacterium]
MQRTTDVWIFQTKGVPIDDLIGYDVEARDGSIGKIDRATAETDRHFVVVDTGFWIFGKKRLVPAGMIERVDKEQGKVFVAMTKDQVKSAPDFDELQHTTYDETYYDQVGGYYGGFRSW